MEILGKKNKSWSNNFKKDHTIHNHQDWSHNDLEKEQANPGVEIDQRQLVQLVIHEVHDTCDQMEGRFLRWNREQKHICFGCI